MRAMALGAATGCHQKPERSFFVAGRQMPLCARCFGAGVGWLLGLLLAAATGLGGPKSALLLVPMAVDGLRQRAGRYESTNPRRFATGLLAGLCCAGLVAGVLKSLLKKRN